MLVTKDEIIKLSDDCYYGTVIDEFQEKQAQKSMTQVRKLCPQNHTRCADHCCDEK